MSRRNKKAPAGGQQQKQAVQVMDAFSNPLFRLGYGSQSPLEATEYPMSRMTDNYALLGSLYRDNWVVQNVVGIIPDDMTKKWYTLSGGIGPAQLAEFQRLQRVTSLRDRSTKACVGAGSTAALRVIMIRGQEGMLTALGLGKHSAGQLCRALHSGPVVRGDSRRGPGPGYAGHRLWPA